MRKKKNTKRSKWTNIYSSRKVIDEYLLLIIFITNVHNVFEKCYLLCTCAEIKWRPVRDSRNNSKVQYTKFQWCAIQKRHAVLKGTSCTVLCNRKLCTSLHAVASPTTLSQAASSGLLRDFCVYFIFFCERWKP